MIQRNLTEEIDDEKAVHREGEDSMNSHLR
jgi:hypothetical protein